MIPSESFVLNSSGRLFRLQICIYKSLISTVAAFLNCMHEEDAGHTVWPHIFDIILHIVG